MSRENMDTEQRRQGASIINQPSAEREQPAGNLLSALSAALIGYSHIHTEYREPSTMSGNRLSTGSTSSKRRLSNGSGLLKMCDGDDSDEEINNTSMCQEKSIYTFPKKSSRRRSSIGGMSASKMMVNPIEQARIAEMYKTVIQMSSENVSIHLRIDQTH
jgi:hypothetical protein